MANVLAALPMRAQLSMSGVILAIAVLPPSFALPRTGLHPARLRYIDFGNT